MHGKVMVWRPLYAADRFEPSGVVEKGGSIMRQPIRSLDECNTWVLWQYDLRGEPIRDDMLRRQVDECLDCRADGVLRGWFKWGTDLDYQAMRWVVEQLHEYRVVFLGGLTASTLIAGENGLSADTLEAMTTTDARGRRHETFEGGNSYHVAIHNPALVRYLVDCAAKQIDAGADGLHLDEIWALGTGVSPTPNEGYDPYAMPRFRQYLQRKYPDFSPADWKRRFDIEDIATFDYRRYLADHRTGGQAWADAPDSFMDDNPLSGEWKPAEVTSPEICETWFEPDPDRSFWDWSILTFGRQLMDGIRSRAADDGRAVYLAQNGPWPGVDVQNWNVPLRPPFDPEARLRCHRDRWRRYRQLTDAWSPPGAPAVAFVDWPGDMPAYTQWPVERKALYLRTAPIEAAAGGVSYAFHLRNYVPGSDARENGTYHLMRDICRWLGEHRAQLGPAAGEAVDVSVEADELCAWAWRRGNRVAVCLVNHAREGDEVAVGREVAIELAGGLRFAEAEVEVPPTEPLGPGQLAVDEAGLLVLSHVEACALVTGRLH
jgi:hypothetical protein